MNQNSSKPESETEARIRANFERQQVMRLLNARLEKVFPGEVHIRLPYDLMLTQQHGYLHAGIITTVIDSACGYAAYSLMPSGSSVVSVEFKINMLRPALGSDFIAIGKVIKAGRTLTICSGELQSIDQGQNQIVAVMQATMMAVARKT